MREISFRGFHECENGEISITVNGVEKRGRWFYGSYCPYNWTISGIRKEEPQIIIHDENSDNDGLWVNVIPETVGQITGLCDKHGKRIFEGDILESQIGDSHKWIVDFADGGFVVRKIGLKSIRYRNRQTNVDDLCVDNVAWYDFEIIRNIFEDLELLSKGE